MHYDFISNVKQNKISVFVCVQLSTLILFVCMSYKTRLIGRLNFIVGALISQRLLLTALKFSTSRSMENVLFVFIFKAINT